MGLLTRAKDQFLGHEQPFGWHVLIGLLIIACGAGVGAVMAIAQGSSWSYGALMVGGTAAVAFLLSAIPRAVGLLRRRRR